MTLPLPADAMVHALARRDFGVFLDLVFPTLNPGTPSHAVGTSRP